MMTHKLTKHRNWTGLLTFLIIIAFLSQNLAWAKGPGMLMHDSKKFLADLAESVKEVEEKGCSAENAWERFKSRHPSISRLFSRLLGNKEDSKRGSTTHLMSIGGLIFGVAGIIVTIGLVIGIWTYRRWKGKKEREPTPEEEAHPPPKPKVRKPVYTDYSTACRENTNFYNIRDFIIRTLIIPDSGVLPLRIEPEEDKLTEMINRMCRLIKDELQIGLKAELPNRLTEQTDTITLRLYERADSLFPHSEPKPAGLYEINRKALLFMLELGVNPQIISFLIIAGLFYDQVFCGQFSESVDKLQLHAVRTRLFSELISRYQLDTLLINGVAELLGYFDQTFIGRPNDLLQIGRKLPGIRPGGGKNTQPHLEKAIEWTLVLLREGRIEKDGRLILRTVEYFRKIRKHDIYSSLEHALGPIRIYWKPGAEVRLFKAGRETDMVEDIVILSKGTRKPGTRNFGIKRIVSKEGKIRQMGEQGIMDLIGRILHDGESFTIERERGNQINYVHQEGQDIYELQLTYDGYIMDLTILPPYRTVLTRQYGFSLAESDKLALIIDKKIPLALPPDLNPGLSAMIDKMMTVRRREYPVEAFLDKVTKDVYIFDIKSGDAIIIDRRGIYIDFIRRINISAFFGNPVYERISSKILRDYRDTGIQEDEGLRERVIDLRMRYPYPEYDNETMLILTSWSQYYTETGALQGGISQEILDEHIILNIKAHYKISPNSSRSPIRFYYMPGEKISVTDRKGEEVGSINDHAVLCRGLEEKIGFNYIQTIDCWQGTESEDILNHLYQTLNNHQRKEIDGENNIYIYLNEDDNQFYIAAITGGEIREFSRLPYHKLGLYHLGICDYGTAPVISDMLNREQPVRVYYIEQEKSLHIVDWSKHVCRVIDTEGRFVEYRENVRHKHYHKRGELKEGIQDVTHAIQKPSETEEP